MKNSILMIVLLIIVGCGKEAQAESTPVVREVTEDLLTVEINLDDMSFEDAFSIEHRAKETRATPHSLCVYSYNAHSYRA